MKSLLPLLHAALLAVAALAMPAQAQDAYPSKPVLVINPWAAGGPAEAIIRPIAEKLSQRLGQQFVVDSRGGANGTIGATAVARARPDGYTLLFSHVGPIASRMKDNGLDPEGTTPEYAAKIRADLTRWAASVKAAGLKE